MAKKIIFAFIFVLILCFVLFAQEDGVKFFSSVDKTQVDVNEVINFKINLEGDFNQVPKIELPKLEEDFEVISSANSENVSWQQGKIKKSSVLELVLSPKKTGAITIGLAKLKIGSKEYSTKPIEIKITGKVSRSDNQSQGADEPPSDEAEKINL